MPLASKYACFTQTRLGGEPCTVSPVQLLKIVRFVSGRLRIPPPTVYIKHTRSGWGSRGRDGTYKITIPHAVLHEKNKAYILTFVLHEVLHTYQVRRWKRNRHGHPAAFHRLEERANRDIFGVGLLYSGTYASVIYSPEPKFRVLWSLPVEREAR